MGVRRKLGDRRNRPRYDVVGGLWGTLETVLQLGLRNVSPAGALIESHVPLPAESIHRLTFHYDDREAATQVRVRHLRPILSADGERTFLIGVEFLSLHPSIVEQIEQWVSGDAGEAVVAEV
jgi:hypothetical protein